MPRILIVDDESSIRFAVGSFFEAKGFEVALADSFATCVASYRADPPDAVILDHRLGSEGGVDLLHVLREIEPGVPVVILTGHGSIDLAVRAIKEGAEQFFTKPIELDVLLVAVQRAVENRRNRRRQVAATAAAAVGAVDPFVGASSAISRLRAQAERLLASESPILIQGETGSGKGVLARWLHAHGRRAGEAFIDVNCASLARDLLESELFGHEKGAFTGAVSAKVGLFEAAEGGTVFLDEIGDMDPAVQPKLLKAVEEKRFRRVGDIRDRHADLLVMTATHRDLGQLVADGRFREDLYFRIAAITLRVPPLRERTEDIPLVARGLIERGPRPRGRPTSISDAAVGVLQSYPWPGNIRELRNVLECAVLLAERPVLEPSDLHFDLRGHARASSRPDSTMTLAEVERLHIEQVLRELEGRVPAAAERLGIPRSSLYAKLKQYGIQRPGSGRGI